MNLKILLPFGVFAEKTEVSRIVAETSADLFAVPNSVQGITPLVGQILVASEENQVANEISELHIFHNRPTRGVVYEPVGQRLLPLDESWRRELAARPWPTKLPPKSSAIAPRLCRR